ncbi:MAG: Modification methylase LlaDCHIA [Pseudomonadota bacterium]|jgi:DNA adenine methylase
MASGSAAAPPRFRPVLKWAGGKGRLLPKILPLLPERIETYFEPFVGGGAVFFALASERRFRRAVLSDLNAELVDVYRGIKKDVEAVIRLLEQYRKKHDADLYYRTRQLEPQRLELAERAARLIYLNKTGYNGLYRVNRKGQFNVPFGSYVNPAICDAERLRAAAVTLRARGLKLEVGDFASVTERAQPGDAVYFDPPYAPRSTTANFTSYHSQEFGRIAHEQLASTLEELTERGVRTVLSNSDTRFTRQLYDRQRFQVQKVLVARPINSKSTARGSVGELLVDNSRTLAR